MPHLSSLPVISDLSTRSVRRASGFVLVGNAETAFVFPGDCHGFIHPDDFEANIWRSIVERDGMVRTRFHDLRHFFASQLIANGETAAFVRDQMGHCSIHVTFDTYGHLFPGRGKEASERFEKSMEIARKKARADVSNSLALDRERARESETSN